MVLGAVALLLAAFAVSLGIIVATCLVAALFATLGPTI